MRRKKLQVFVSSTYTDLKRERQAAVEAILQSGHIPAGMELFAAGDESQMKVIQRWIDESDVFLLILGGRYGSIEPISKKSYTHLEYEYAGSKKKARFAVVMDKSIEESRVKEMGTVIIERDNTKEFVAFREQVTSNAMVKFWTNSSDIQLAVFQTLAEFADREDLIGWILGDQGFNAGPLAEQMARLLKENEDLKEVLQKVKGVDASFTGLSFDEIFEMLLGETVTEEDLTPSYRTSVINRASGLKQKPLTEAIVARSTELRVLGVEPTSVSLLHVFWVINSHPEYMISGSLFVTELDWPGKRLLKMSNYGLMELKGSGIRPTLTETGRRFLLRIQRNIALASRDAASS